jgi:DNA/RNA endonuclease YhcR with UshA esterase domain
MRITLFVFVLASLPVQAHHSFAGTYDATKEVTVKGKIVQVSLRSPHSFFFVEAEDDKGTLQRWTIEGASAAQFAQQGVSRDAFEIGDPVEILGNPARSMTSGFRARLLKITRTTDGKSWGSRPGETVQ